MMSEGRPQPPQKFRHDNSREVREYPFAKVKEQLVAFLDLPRVPPSASSKKSEPEHKRRIKNERAVGIKSGIQKIAEKDPEWKTMDPNALIVSAELLGVNFATKPQTFIREDGASFIRFQGGSDSESINSSWTYLLKDEQKKKEIGFGREQLVVEMSRLSDLDHAVQVGKFVSQLFGVDRAHFTHGERRPGHMTFDGAPAKFDVVSLSAPAGTAEDVLRVYQAFRATEALLDGVRDQARKNIEQVTHFDRNLNTLPREYEKGYLYEFVESSVLSAMKRHVLLMPPEDAYRILDLNAILSETTLTPTITIEKPMDVSGREIWVEETILLPTITLPVPIPEFRLQSIPIEYKQFGQVKGKIDVALPKDMDVKFQAPFYADRHETNFGHDLRTDAWEKWAEWLEATIPKPEPEYSARTEKFDQTPEQYLAFLTLSLRELEKLSPHEAIRTVRAKLNEMTKKFHPDVTKDNGEMMRKINEARNCLVKTGWLDRTFHSMKTPEVVAVAKKKQAPRALKA